MNIIALGCRHPHWSDYVRQITSRKGFRLSHVWDRDRAALARALSETGAEPFDPACPVPDIAAALVLSETSLHLADVGALLPWRCPLFVEKPLAGCPDHVVRLSRMMSETACPFHTGFFLRELTALRHAKAIIDNRVLGSVRFARIRFAHDGLRRGWLTRDDWLLSPSLAGFGGFGDLAVHGIDLASAWNLGPLTPVDASFSRITGLADREDFGAALLRFTGGGTLLIEAGWASGGGPMLEIEVLGSSGTLRSVDGRLMAEWDNGHASRDVGTLLPDAGAGLEPFLTAVETGDWSGCVTVSDAESANLILCELDRRGNLRRQS